MQKVFCLPAEWDNTLDYLKRGCELRAVLTVGRDGHLAAVILVCGI